MNNIEIQHEGKTFTFRVEVEQDDWGLPWEEHDGHGPVSEWTARNKLPGERVLNSDRSAKRYYDVAEATKIAKRDGWGISEECVAELAKKLGRKPTQGEITAAAVERDFEYLRGWANDEWCWQWVQVRLLDDEGDGTDITESVGGIEDRDPNYLEETARELAESLVERYGTEWGEVTKQTYGLLEKDDASH